MRGDIAQCPDSPLEINFGNSILKVRQSRYQTFPALSSFTGFFHFV